MNRFVLSAILVPVLFFGQEGKDNASELISGGMTAYSQGEYVKAIKFFKDAFILRPQNTAISYNIACCFALNSEADSALIWLEKSIDLGAYVFADDEDFKSLQGLSRFEELKMTADKKIQAIKDRQLLPVIALPDNYTPLQQWPVVIALHGFGANPVDFCQSLKSPVIQNGHLLVCPYGVEIRGTTSFGWGEDPILVGEKIKDIIDWAHNALNVDTARVILLGYSQGGWLAYFLGLSDPKIYEGVIAVAGYFPDEADSLLNNLERIDIKFYAMIGEQDHSFQSNQKAGNVFGKKNIAYKVQSYPDLGHAFPPDADQEVGKALKWIESE